MTFLRPSSPVPASGRPWGWRSSCWSGRSRAGPVTLARGGPHDRRRPPTLGPQDRPARQAAGLALGPRHRPGPERHGNGPAYYADAVLASGAAVLNPPRKTAWGYRAVAKDP